MDVLLEHPDVHLDVESAWRGGRSACVLRPENDAIDYQRQIALSYDGPPALITWTTGTTGRPKGVVIPWRAVEARCRMLAAYLTPDQIAAVTTPLNADHSLGIITSRLAIRYAGGAFRAFPGGAGITCVIGTPRRLKQICARERGFEVDCQNLSLVISSGAPLQPADRAMMARVLNAQVIDSYASSETGPIALDGELLPGCEVKIDGGRILVKTAGLATGYIGSDQPLPVQDGWFVTPDIGQLAEGKLTIIGRRKIRQSC